MPEYIFNKVAVWKSATLLKRYSSTGANPVNLAKRNKILIVGKRHCQIKL